jgi:hypothetical protein
VENYDVSIARLYQTAGDGNAAENFLINGAASPSFPIFFASASIQLTDGACFL